MTIAVNATKETLATSYTGQAVYASLHTADPGTTGTSEATGGSPAYARKLLAWTGGASDGVSAAAAVVFDLPAGTFTYLGLWSAVSGGTFIDKSTISSVTLGAQGQISVTPTFTQS